MQTQPAVSQIGPEKASKPKHIITIDINTESERMILCWPGECEMLLDDLRPEESGIPGQIVWLYNGHYKKVAPLDVQQAKMVLDLMLPYKQLGLVRIKASKPFKEWYALHTERESRRNAAQAILEVDPKTVQTRFDEFAVDLYWWQTVGAKFLGESTDEGLGAILADRVGLGKTYTAAAHAFWSKHLAVVVAPAGLRWNWVNKIKHLRPQARVFVMDNLNTIEAHNADFIVVSYKMLERLHVIAHLAEIIKTQKRILILDEAHYIKNIDSNRTKHCLMLGEYAHHVIPVTATPLVNRARELYPLLKITGRMWTSASLKDFRKMYETPQGETELAERLRGVMIRRHGEDVRKDMPDSEVGETFLELTNRDDYDSAERDFINWLMAKGANYEQMERAERGLALMKLNRLRQLAVEGKTQPTIELVQSILDSGEQVVLFSSFKAPIRKIVRHFSSAKGKNYLNQEWRGSALITGDVDEGQRNRSIQAFNAGKIGVMACSIRCGVGFDLPAACMGYFIDLPWAPADFEQCMGRLARIGQKRDCFFNKLLAENTIDQRMDEIIFQKAHSFMRAIDDPRAVERITPTNGSGGGMGNILDRVVSSYIQKNYLVGK